MRFWLCLLCMIPAACRPDSPPAPAPASPAAVPSAPEPGAATPAVAPVPPGSTQAVAPARSAAPAGAPVAAAHGAEIVALGVTADGGAVASADRLGGIRLWTALDGTREPVVIRGAAPRAITLARDDGGFAIGTLDAAGGVHVTRVSAHGAVRGRTTVGERPAVEIDSTSEGLLILRADQTVELVAPTGAILARLVPEPGTHIAEILVRGSRVLALVEQDNRLYGRWILLDRGVRWGASTPRLRSKIGHAVLSPDGTRLAVTRPGVLRPALIDLATGAALPAALCVPRDWTHERSVELELLQGDSAPVPLGFLTDTVVACSLMGSLRWWSTATAQDEPTSFGSVGIARVPVAMSDTALILGAGPSLGLVSPARARYVGYAMHDVGDARVAPGGVLAIGRDQQALVLGGDLRERARLDVGRGQIDWTDAVLVDDRHALVAVRDRRSHQETIQIAVFDGVTRSHRQVLPYDVRELALSYEPATRLLALSDGPGALLVRFDPASHMFGPPMRLASAISATRLVAIDPGPGPGIAALAIDQLAGGVLVGEIHHDDLTPGAQLRPRATYRVPGVLRAVDRAGRLYMRTPADGEDVVVYTRGVAGARLPGVGALELRPSGDGSLIAAFRAPRLVLLDADGSVRWDTAHWGIAEVGWLATGELIARLPSAIARVELATGGLAERRCGLAFGVSEQPFEDGRAEASVCEVDR
jgi:hypothetical protein